MVKGARWDEDVYEKNGLLDRNARMRAILCGSGTETDKKAGKAR